MPLLVGCLLGGLLIKNLRITELGMIGQSAHSTDLTDVNYLRPVQ